MSVQSPERVDPDVMTFESEEFDIECDIAVARRGGFPGGFPVCNGDPARWVAWRPNCCPGSPKYRLICDKCKTTYQNWIAHNAYMYCGTCMSQTGGFIAFTPLKGKS